MRKKTGKLVPSLRLPKPETWPHLFPFFSFTPAFYITHLVLLTPQSNSVSRCVPFSSSASYQNLSMWIKLLISYLLCPSQTYPVKHISYCTNTLIRATKWPSPTGHYIKFQVFNKACKTFWACLSFYSYMSIPYPNPQ